MSMDRKSDGASSRMNLKTFRNHFADLVDLAEQWQIDLPKIVVIGKRNDSGVKDLIQNLFGFSICLKEINDPVLYRFIKDDTCGDNEAFCTVNDALVEIDLMTEYETVIDQISQWDALKEEVDGGREPICLDIRANFIDNVEVMDVRFDSFSSTKYWLGQFQMRHVMNHAMVAIDRGITPGGDLIRDYAVCTRASLGSLAIEECIPKIRLAIFESLIASPQFQKVHREFQVRLMQLDGPIPETENRKRRMLSTMFREYKESLDKIFLFASVCRDTVADVRKLPHKANVCPIVDESSRTLGAMILRFRTILDERANANFPRFPLIISELVKISQVLLETMVNSPLKQGFGYVSQSHFTLAHEFVCTNRRDGAERCEYEVLAEAFMGFVIDRMRHKLFAIIESQLFSWVHLLQESDAITNERYVLRKKMKLMHNVYASMKKSDNKTKSN